MNKLKDHFIHFVDVTDLRGVLQPLQKLRELLAKPNKRLTLTAAE